MRANKGVTRELGDDHRSRGEVARSPVAREARERRASNVESAKTASRVELERKFWELWLSCYSDLLRQSLVHMNGNRAEAEDAVSHAALHAFTKYPQHANTITNPRGWLTRLVFNVCMDWHRQRVRFGKVTEGLQSEQATHLGLVGADARSPEHQFAERERAQRVKGSIESLPTHLRDPFVLRFMSERSYEEIAEQLGLSSVNIRKRIQLARAILRDDLSD